MKVSVVTPSFNQGRFIGRTLASVASQNGVTFEHWVFDGGSTDETVDVLRASGEAVRWTSQKDGGQADAVNKGIATSDGDIIAWLNSDDIYYAGALARVVAFFEQHPDVDVVYGDADHVDEADLAFEAYPTEPWNPDRLLQTCYLCQPAVFFRRRVVERFGLLDADLHYCMDYEYWLRLAAGGAQFAYLPHKLAGSRLYAQNKTLGSTIKVHREINDMMHRKFGRVPDAWLYNYAYVRTRQRVDPFSRPRSFIRESSVRAVVAAIQWNGYPSRALLHRLFPNWVGPAKSAPPGNPAK